MARTPLPLKLRPYLILGVMGFIIMEIVALSPAPLEQPSSTQAMVNPESFFETGQTTLASGIPTNRVADYSVDDFNYVSTQKGQKAWKLLSKRAFLYNKEKLVHARTITAQLFDPQGRITVVTGKEAKYFMDQRDLEVFGDVVTKFPDGFELRSEYLRYKPRERSIEIPAAYAVHGEGQEDNTQRLAFDSYGFDFAMEDNRIQLPSRVAVNMTKTADGQTTRIESDHCLIDRTQHVSHFTMNPNRALETRFVRITQPGLFARARRADLSYGDPSSVLQFLVAYEDVLIKEKTQPNESGQTSLRYGTGGRAEFNTQENVIVLKEFPQVYQDNDTVTGDVITVHRDTDVVEVDHSNAFSEGQKQQPDASGSGASKKL